MFFFLFLLLLGLPWPRQAQAGYRVGTGKADITGPALGAPMMGYAELSQVSLGINDRQWARAFIIEDDTNDISLVIVVIDACSVFASIYQAVLAHLKSRYKNQYSEANLVLTATHTHSANAGLSHHFLYNMPSGLFDPLAFETVVNGIMSAIDQAHQGLAPGKVFFNQGLLRNANINRSLPAYLNNPDREDYTSSTDEQMQLLRLEREGRPAGVIAWFASHAVSYPKTNRFLSSDNKGYAAWLFEQFAREQFSREQFSREQFSREQFAREQFSQQQGQAEQFVAAFPQTDAGDMSPNLSLDGTGPYANAEQNVRAIGYRHFQKAKSLFLKASEEISGPILSIQQMVDFTQLTVQPRFSSTNQSETTCIPAMGYSFASGTEDGRPGGLVHLLFNFPEGTLNSTGFHRALTRYLTSPTQEDILCHHPKPILVALGKKNFHWLNHWLPPGNMPREIINQPWVPPVVPVLLAQLGSLYIAAAPAEYTVMAGRRIRNSIAKVAVSPVDKVIFAGYSNDYLSYVSTPEEYDMQHYEGASTLFGRTTLDGYRQVFAELAEDLIQGSCSEHPVAKAVDLKSYYQDIPGLVIPDRPPRGYAFGDVLALAVTNQPPYRVTAEFCSSHPRNGIFLDSFLYIQQWQAQQQTWVNIANDNDWTTRIHWRPSLLCPQVAVVEWNPEPLSPGGHYRLVHRGVYRLDRASSLTLGPPTYYQGYTDTFVFP